MRGYKEEGTITTAFDMTVLNELDRFHLVMSAIDRLPQTGERGHALKRLLQGKLLEHRRYIRSTARTCPRSATGPGARRAERHRPRNAPRMNQQQLIDTARALVAGDRGLLAMDESTADLRQAVRRRSASRRPPRCTGNTAT